MALRNNEPTNQAGAAPTPTPPAAQTTAKTPSFEEEDNDVAVAERPAAAPAPAAATPVAPSAQTAVAKATSGAVSIHIARNTAIQALKDVIPQEDLESMGVGTFPRITVDQGGFALDKTTRLGEEIDFEVVSWNFVWLVTTGEQNNVEANKLIRTSYDGENLKDQGGTIQAYIDALKLEGYKKAECKKYVEIYGQLINSSKGGIVAPEERSLSQISVSPQSVSQWGRFNLESGMRKAKGIDDGNVVHIVGKAKTIGANTFGVMNFSPFKAV